MIELTDRNDATIAINPDHVSLARGFETTASPPRKMCEIMFLSGDWLTLELGVREVLEALADARPTL